MTPSTEEEFVHLLGERETVYRRISAALRAFGGEDRTLALKASRRAGIPATELAQLAGISRARLYQLLDKSV